MQQKGRSTLVRAVFLLLGIAMLAMGIIGIFVPLMPTTVFLIAAAWCFGRSSERLEWWMLEHPRFGPLLRGWREHGAIPRRAKWLACIGLSTGFALFLYRVQPQVWLAVSVALMMASIAVWIITRPENLE